MPPMNFSADLLDSFRKETACLFIGSGVSSAAGLIGWDTLIQEMCKIIRAESTQFTASELDKFLNESDNLDIADYFRQTVKEYRYYRFLRRYFRTDARLTRLHKVIATLPAKTLFTTNYDKVLETTFRAANGSDPAVIIFPEQIGYIDSDEQRIIKLHGDIDHPSTIVLTRTDYSNYASTHRDFVDMLEHGLNERTLLFVGFGLRDKNFRRIFEDARSLYASTKRPAYAFMSDTHAIERELWSHEGLVIIPMAHYTDLARHIFQFRQAI